VDWIYILGSGLFLRDIEWLEDALNSCASKYKIVVMHHPPINWGDYDIIARNREVFISLCDGYDVELVLAGHSHAARVFDSNRNFYPNDVLPLNLDFYPTLYVQTDACQEGLYYRNITFLNGNLWLGPCELLYEVDY
jgi:3',5'-cyclic AMP phosphodiesterase CpdA